ncbi:hypothetical protein Fmac_021429 [Flemingia macrophylla]|uniref:hydroxyethylthiazole kinase n=1 Tax=Flemingia macrophylla TaxID=520843 RepID=A0ABD1LWU3_9FABA
MLHAAEELSNFIPHAAILCVNVSMLCPSWLLAINTAAKLCSDLGTPWVLDPVDASASAFSKLCSDLGTPWVLDPIDASAFAKLYSDLGTPWILDPIDASASVFRFHARHQLLLLNPNLVRGNASKISPSKGEPVVEGEGPKGVENFYGGGWGRRVMSGGGGEGSRSVWGKGVGRMPPGKGGGGRRRPKGGGGGRRRIQREREKRKREEKLRFCTKQRGRGLGK